MLPYFLDVSFGDVHLAVGNGLQVDAVLQRG